MKTKDANRSSAYFPRTAYRIKGFTLIELLVVIGLIAVLAAGIGLSMRGGNPSSALRAGQNSLVGLLSSARGQAALSQADAMIVVDVTSGSQEALRSLQVVVSTGTDRWRPVGAPVLLPEGIYVVPSIGSTTPVTLIGPWTNKRRSSGFISAGAETLTERDVDATYTIPKSNAFVGRTYMKFQTFSSLGTTGGAGVLLVTSGRRTSETIITLDNPEFVRGVLLSRYGVPTFLNETDSLDKL